jgi:hypothetical protein
MIMQSYRRYYIHITSREIIEKSDDFQKIFEFRGNPGISGKSGNFGKCRGKFPGFRGKLFFRISEIPKLSGTFSAKFVFFIKTALRSRVHTIKINVKFIKIHVFSEKNPPKMSREVSGKSPEIPGKKSAIFFRFFSIRRKDTAYFWKIRGKKFPGKSDIFRENISEKIPEIPENSGNSGKFRKKKCQKRRFSENSTLVCRACFKTHIFKALKSKKKKVKIYARLRTGFPEMHEIFPRENRQKRHF